MEREGIGRRAFLTGLGGSAGLLLAGRPGIPGWLGRGPVGDLDYRACLSRLDTSLSPTQRALTVHGWDHPARQVTNTVAVFKGPHIGTLFDAEQVALIERIYGHMVSAQGRSWLNDTVTLEGKLTGCVFAIYSDAEPGELAADFQRTQSMISGGHLLLRQGGAEASGYAFGGPIAYGQQLGNERFKVEGNAFAVHGDAANRFYTALDEDGRTASRVTLAPHELAVQALGPDGSFSGVPLKSVSASAREASHELIETVLASYPAAERADARDALAHNGGLDALHVSFYERYGFYADGSRFSELGETERARREEPYWQVWRIEGPGCVIHFQGSPHVHAYVNIVRDLDRQQVGEVLTEAPDFVEGEAMRRLLMDALRRETGEELAYYAEPMGRICPGAVTTGLVYALDPFANGVVVATVRGDAMAPVLRESVVAQGAEFVPTRRYRIATIDYLTQRTDRFGDVERVDAWPRPMRELLTAYLRDRNLERSARG